MSALSSLRYPSAFSIFFLGFTFHSSSLPASFVSVANPGSPSSITAQFVRAGATLQGSIFSPSNDDSSVNMNHVTGNSFGSDGLVAFQVGFDSGSGAFSLSVDFNQDGTFSSNEKLTLSLAERPGMEDFRGRTFKFVSISVTESNPWRNSSLEDLQINDSSFESIHSGETTSEVFFQNVAANPATEILVSGNLMLNDLTDGRGRTTWSVNFSSPMSSTRTVTVIPEPAAGFMFLLGGIVLAYRARRLRSSLERTSKLLQFGCPV